MVFEQEEHSSPVTMITLLLLPVINSILDVLRKILVERLKSPLLVTSIRASLHAIFLYLLSTYSQELNFEVKKWLSSTCNWVNAFIIFLGSIFYLKAIMISNLSSTVPLLSQTPFFLMLTGCLWYGETINITSSLGLFLIIIGYVAMNFSNLATSKNVLKINIYTLFFPTDKGAKFIMMVPLLWSISAALEQTSLVELNTHPTVHICLTQAVVALISLCFLFLRPYSVEYLGEEIVDVLDYKSLRTSKRDKDLGKEQLFNGEKNTFCSSIINFTSCLRQ
ncbi:hypothetical protein HK099_000326 [Clydaea vesicula]|uniref:EamA domain-containing protein n=1 Tax=Clydaea vesicula TaxID=447962 RepID=A0AAD5Y032_9FUNG|nr:hypothetical protein HK099_000326 [Clydaea vesicula]